MSRNGIIARTQRAWPCTICIFALMVVVFATHSACGAEFFGIDIDTPSEAMDVSANGSVVVGAGGTGGLGFRWTLSGGAVSLGDLSGGGTDTQGHAVNTNGDIIVGIAQSGIASQQAMRWEQSTGVVGLDIGPNPSGSARGVSSDGSIVAGVTGNEATLWTSTGRTTIPTTYDAAAANAITPDGHSVLIQGSTANFSSLAIWQDGVGAIPLTGTIGNEQFGGRITPDGEMVLGSAGFGGSGGNQDYVQWFRWTSTGGMIPLPLIAGFEGGIQGTDFTADGSIVVGRGILSKNASGSLAVIWDETNGARLLQDELVDVYGLDLTGWTLRSAWAISDDGNVVAGEGLDPDGNRRAWVAIIPEPSSAALVVCSVVTLVMYRRSNAAAAWTQS